MKRLLAYGATEVKLPPSKVECAAQLDFGQQFFGIGKKALTLTV